MEDGEGRRIDFRHSIILLTTNVGTESIMAVCQNEANLPSFSELQQVIESDLNHHFPAALLGRMVTLPYYPLSKKSLQQIVQLQLAKIIKRISDKYSLTTSIEASVVDAIVSRCHQGDYGARLIDLILTNTLLPEISRTLLGFEANQRAVSTLSISVDGKGFSYQFE